MTIAMASRYIQCMNSGRARRPPGILHEGRLFKAGNSLAIRIPNAIVKHLRLSDGAPLRISVDGDAIWLRLAPAMEREELIAQITPENQHEPMLEELIGRERW